MREEGTIETISTAEKPINEGRDHEREVNAHVEAFERKKRLREAKEREDLPRDMICPRSPGTTSTLN